MSRMIQILAVMLGAVWFLPVSCTTHDRRVSIGVKVA